MDLDSGQVFMSILSESGPTIAFLVGGVFWLSRRVDAIEQRVDQKLNNGIKAELSKTQQRLANIEGQLAALPRRRTDSGE